MESYSVHLLHSRINFPAQGQKRQVAYEYEIFDARFERRQNSGRTDALQHHPDKALCNVFSRSIGLGIAEEWRHGTHRKSRKRFGADVFYQQVNVCHIAILGKLRHLQDVVGLQQQARQTLQRSTANGCVCTTYAFLSEKPDVTVSSQRLLTGKTGKSSIKRT